jgi:glycosyltransferase involved in cell wall biosynthesis
MRFLGLKNNKIQIVSNTKFYNPDLSIIELSEDYNNISDSDLILNYRVFNNKIYSKCEKKKASELKIALVGNWKMSCGISTYNESLWSEIEKLVGDVKLFIEENDQPTGDIYKIGNKTLSEDKVISCWKRGNSLSFLIKNIKEYNPDIILIGHEFGLWNNASYWLSMITQLSDYRVIVTMHSTFHHQDKSIVEHAVPEIIVHLDSAKDILLNEKKINSKIYVVPHGCHLPINNRLWNFYKSNHTFMQFGFLFRYKGWENAIKATALLKEKYNDVFFTGICSESQFNPKEHQIYYNELLGLIDDLKINENICLLRGFKSDQALDSYLGTNQAALFCYTIDPDHGAHGASGAARLALSRGLPVITSSAPHFSDLPTIKADTPEAIASELDKLFSSNKIKEEQINIQNEYLINNSWENIAKKYINIFEL